MVATELVPNKTEIFMAGIDALDFRMVKLKIQDKEEGYGWERSLCDEVEVEYKRFLALKREYPFKEIVPNQLVDKFWHQHILDTQKYAEDCNNIFGTFLHHFPYFGMNGKQDFDNLCEAFEESKALYSAHFTNELEGEVPRCRTACKPVKCK